MTTTSSTPDTSGAPPPVGVGDPGWPTDRTGRVVRFLVVGGSSAAIDVGLLVGFREFGRLSIPVATTVAFWIALAYNFALNRAWTFRGTDKAGARLVGGALARYLVVVGVNYVVTLTIVTGGSAMGIPYPIAKVLAIGIGTLYTYLAYERWVFA